MESVQISLDEAKRVGYAALRQAELSPEDLETILEVLLDAETSGRAGHGLMRIPSIVERVQQCPAGSEAIRLTRDAGHVLALDGGRAVGYLTACRATELALQRLETSPLVAVGCCNTGHTGAIGCYTRRLADAGHAALAMGHCTPLLAPHGGNRPVLGTNPIAMGIPGPDQPLVVDLSPAMTTYGAIMNARREGRPLPEPAALDEAGQPTTDPFQALIGGILPIAGAKGSGLAFLVQCLGGILCGGAALPKPWDHFGFLLLGFRLDAFTAPESVRERMAELADAMHAAGALCPGEQSVGRQRAAREQGLTLDRPLWDTLCAMAGTVPENAP